RNPVRVPLRLAPCPQYTARVAPETTVNCEPQAFNSRHDRSKQIFASAQQYMPGGVNSPVRAFNAVGGDPVVMAMGKGAHTWDVDGNEYIDYVGSWGALILG